jgi:hypothetical protein
MRAHDGHPPNSEMLFCNLCKKHVRPFGHMCVAEDGSGRPEEHLAECKTCEAFHEPHCVPVEPVYGSTGRVVGHARAA